MKYLPALAFAILVALSPKAEAQLNGEYSFEISQIFGTSPYAFRESNSDSYHSDDQILLRPITSTSQKYLSLGSSTLVHNPKNGSFNHRGAISSNFDPADLNQQLDGDEDSWSFYIDGRPPMSQINGKTYTDRKTKKSVIDFSGVLNLYGSYGYDEVEIIKGSLVFRGNKIECDKLLNSGSYGEDENAKISVKGAITLKNKQKKIFPSTTLRIEGMFWGGEYTFIGSASELGFTSRSGCTMDLNLTSSSGRITGSAKLYYHLAVEYLTPDGYPDSTRENWSLQHPDPETPAKEFTYSVKGTSKNGIATLNLTGRGVIKGLKATLYINEETEEIVQNGKNSITLYGQTITY